MIEFAVAGRRVRGQRVGMVVDLDHRAQGVVAVLVLAAADLQQMVERQPTSPCQKASMGSRLLVERPKSMRGLARCMVWAFPFNPGAA